MSLVKKLLCLLLALCLLASVSAVAMAAENLYTVRILAGAQGSIDGSEILEFHKPYGYVFTAEDFDVSRVTVLNEKYYAKGIREAGRDNEELSYLGRVTRDQDYLVVYAVRGDQVSYTVEFRDENGNELTESRTLYGNVGDKPVVTYRFIDGYQPRYYNLTKTLSENAAENLFVFTYTREVTPTPRPANPGGGATVRPTPTPAATASPAPSEAPRETEAPAPSEEPAETPAPSEEPAETPVPSAEPTPSEPEEILDLDVPQARPEQPTPQPEGKSHTGLIVAAAAAAVVAGAGGLWFVLARKKRKENYER